MSHHRLDLPLNPNTAEVNGLMHIYSLLTHIRQTTDRILGVERTQSAEAMRYLVDSFARFSFAYHNAICKSLSQDEETKDNPALWAFWQQRAMDPAD